jgi:uncharacterized membrane protein YccC
MGFALPTTAAALFALAVAENLSIHHPWWAAMTVWLVAQPTRGLLLERSLARLAGTVCGAFAGALILGFLAQHWLPALFAVAAWLALCAGLGSIFRHFRNYGFVLAGYTAAIVVLFGLGDGNSDPGLASDRVLCTVIGILSSALVSFHSLPSGERGMAARAEDLLHRSLSRVEAFLLGRELQPATALVSDIGAFDRAIDEYAAGSFRRRREALRIGHVSGVLLELIALATQPKQSDAVTSPWIEAADGTGERIRKLMMAAMTAGQSAMANALGELGEVLNPIDAASQVPIKLDFDPASVWRAAARPVVALTIAAVAWQAIGWQTGAMMVMTAALFTSLFSSHDQGNRMVIQVLLGTLLGAVAGIAARLFLLPHATGLLPTLLCITPFLIAGARLMRWPATSKMAIDLTMTFLLTAQPGSVPASAVLTLSEAAAIVAGVLIAVATFWFILPATPEVRCRLLARRIARLTARVARSPDRTAAETAQRSLRIAQVRLLDFVKAGSAIFRAAETCIGAANTALAAKNNGSVIPPGASSPSSHLRPPDDAALQASAALDALILSSRRRNSR